MRVKREVASITLSSTLWRTRIISVRATLWRIATASAWQWGSEGATAGCDRDEWRPGGLRSNPSSVHLFTVGGLLRKTGQQGERCWHCSGGLQAESRVNKFPKHSLWCIIVFTSIVCPYGGSCCILFRNDLLKLTVVQFVMSQWDTDWETLSFIQFTNILKVQQSLNFCRKRTLNILQEGKYGVFRNIQKPLSAICTMFHSVYLKLPIKLIFIPYFQTAAHRMKLEEVSKYFHHGILYTSHWIHSHRRTNFGQKVVKKLKIPPISRTLKQCSVGQTVFCRKKKTFIVGYCVGWLVCCFICHSVCVVLHLQGLQTAFGITADMSCKLVQNFLGIAAVNYSEGGKWGHEKGIICVCSRLFFPVHFCHLWPHLNDFVVGGFRSNCGIILLLLLYHLSSLSRRV